MEEIKCNSIVATCAVGALAPTQEDGLVANVLAK